MYESETMDLEQLARYLCRDLREVTKWANRGHVPGQKVGGQWRFAQAEINLWIEQQLPNYTIEQLEALERRHPEPLAEPLIARLLGPACIAWPLRAATRVSVLKELVNLAEQSWQVYDPAALADAIRQREEVGSTALDEGVAIPHPRRPLPNTVLGEPVVALANVPSGIPFGAPRGGLTDLFFLVASPDQATHLRLLARLSRLFRVPGFLDSLRQADTAAEAHALLESVETSLVGE